MDYKGSCHCGSVSFQFRGDEITSGVRCNCSICRRKGALMTSFVIAPQALQLDIKNEALQVYRFGSEIAAHYFCKQCGIYPFHQTLRKKDHYRINIGCIDGTDPFSLPVEVFDGASL